jgi:hypothetical protein
MSDNKMKCIVGLLLRGGFRRYLDRLRFDGYIGDWYEGKGWIDSDFYIRVKDQRVRSLISGWFQERSG